MTSNAAISSTQAPATLRSLAERIGTLRMERGFRLADLAALSGFSETHLYRLEQGERWPSVPALLTLANIYGVDPSHLLSGPTPPERIARHRSRATWDGRERTGSGEMVARGISVPFDRDTRVTSTEPGDAPELASSPEDHIGMAFAGCFSMSLAKQLEAAGFEPRRIDVSADVQLGMSPDQTSIVGIHVGCEAEVSQVEEARFQEIAQITKRTCVVARALMAVPVSLDARLVNSTPRRPTRSDGDRKSVRG